MATPSPNSTAVALTALTSTARKTQPILWTQNETLLLIGSYKAKWYEIGRGPLKFSHWEEIDVAVCARSGFDRSATQCRHKIEKLRKRFKTERQSMGPISIWPFYTQMEELEINPAPISAQPLTRLPPNHYEDEIQRKSRSIGGGLSKKRKVKDEVGEMQRKGTRAVADEIKAFAERVMIMEKKQLEFAKETMKLRKEMEIQRLQLIQTSQANLLQFLNTAFDSF